MEKFTVSRVLFDKIRKIIKIAPFCVAEGTVTFKVKKSYIQFLRGLGM